MFVCALRIELFLPACHSLKEKRAVTVGYKYYHISNGDRGLQNPGFDNNVFYIGYTFFSK